MDVGVDLDGVWSAMDPEWTGKWKCKAPPPTARSNLGRMERLVVDGRRIEQERRRRERGIDTALSWWQVIYKSTLPDREYRTLQANSW
eukprot:scaffold776_cov347-Pavlova_lutheri.AAC.103